ncbi:hypothetical protein [Siphonobacter sp. SORGH_AS_0500]|uniref:hypothetical protein n=1 Tax=Siphonobacter sp. SORGH_AS_0500 TaxID=1864824 RepID=UPI002860ACF3|nr:hypothetical protein [Siphonobacter sp. SORGH_AS_0500]MDR6193308.1 hypothetical protein [Siphonobacter sp. SORGH_AS_0500]
MKSRTLTLLKSTLILYVTLLSSCSHDKAVIDKESVDINQIYKLEEPALLDDNMYLPKGTEWHYTNEKGSAVSFTLPKGYSYLMKRESDGSYYVASDPSGGSGYSCSCSKSGSCKVFYQSKVGYGCLQDGCTGSCTGTPSTPKTPDKQETIVGILNNKNDQLENLSAYSNRASLTTEGKKAFFMLPEVQKELSKNYDLLYKNSAKPDFDKIDPNNLPSTYFIGKFSLLGVEIGLLLPKEESLFRVIPGLRTMAAEPAPPACSCSGKHGGDNCKLHKDCFLGNCAYSCSGCTTCSMAMD